MRVERPTAASAFVMVFQIAVMILYVLGTVVHAVLLGWLQLIPRFRRERLATALIRPVWGWYSNVLAGMRVRVIGRENLPAAERGYLFAGNHESFLDILLLVLEVGATFLMKRSVLLSPLGWGTYWMGSVGFDRRNPQARRRALVQTLEMAERARSVIVFPEGTFGHRDGRLREPRLNLVRQAFDRGLSVVPFGHAGTRRALDGQTLPVRRGAEVVLVVRPPLDPGSFSDGEAFAQACWAEVEGAVSEARAAIAPGWPYSDALPFEEAA